VVSTWFPVLLLAVLLSEQLKLCEILLRPLEADAQL